MVNQTWKSWIFFDALNVGLLVNVFMQNEMERSEIIFFNLGGGDFEYKLGVLCIYMMVKIKVIFTLFMAFASISNATKAHNMIALMLDDYCLNL